ncbi:methyltransferase [Aeromicrobium duanguangcaii]|uniref:Methyltransferase n=1 Tax=Aeromicrobium duanguangcaii TaxID=2968086 RepID=A0ABY5KFI4_9ACTN|nr:methyltransferase domain-containing protein [Aeromicrobium duanguangcaii]MCD9153694.1 methyltransferase [Aeromicrobium duanguangcaii]UUI69226.1 methyltransferase [Aeromicrobium duanguangcaii]
MEHDPIVARLRAAGCVFAEAEAAFIRRHLQDTGDIERAVESRTEGMPLEHAVGVAEFAGLTVAVADGVFVPRLRAEAIASAAAAHRPDARVVVDLGCGCGALAAALASRLPGTEVHAVDIDPASVVVARANGRRFGFTAHHGSWWDALPTALRGRVDLAVGYLPHVPTDRVERIHPDFRSHEPRHTVDGGPTGLDQVRAVAAPMGDWLSPEGVFVTLLSTEQAAAVPGRVLSADDEDAVMVLDGAAVGHWGL